MTTPEALQTALEAVVGPAGMLTDAAHTSAFAVGTARPRVVVRPETVEQAAEIVALAGREQLAVVPWGQGTQMYLGRPPRRYDLALSLAGLRRIVEYDVANFTMIAEAGVPLGEIYKLSVPKRQFLPLGFPGTTASLGGLLVTNTSGVKRERYGALRDLLLGVRVGLPDGSIVHFGGRVVKNVAGYDMNKLFVGSLGVFGVVLETTYRLVALPEDDRMLAVAFPTLTHATAAAAAVQGSQLLPSALMLLNAGAAAACPAVTQLPIRFEQVVLLLNFDGTHEAVQRQIHDSLTLCRQHGGVDETLITGETLFEVWAFQEAWRAAPADTDPPRLQMRLGALPSHVEKVVQYLTIPQTFCPQRVQWLADYSHGQIFAHLPVDSSPSPELENSVQDWLRQCRRQIRHWDGYCVVEYAPAPLLDHLDLWGEIPGRQLLQLYKQRFDPSAVLNPGRYVVG